LLRPNEPEPVVTVHIDPYFHSCFLVLPGLGLTRRAVVGMSCPMCAEWHLMLLDCLGLAAVQVGPASAFARALIVLEVSSDLDWCALRVFVVASQSGDFTGDADDSS
jgi:hypothetical protein